MFKMKKIIGTILFLGIFSLALLPSITQAGLVPCANTEHPEPCTLCHFLVGFKVLIDYGLSILIALSLGAITVSGVMYLLAFTDEGMVKSAKEMLTGTLKGFAIVISAWLIVNIVLFIVAPHVGAMTGKTNWYTIECNTTSSVVK